MNYKGCVYSTVTGIADGSTSVTEGAWISTWAACWSLWMLSPMKRHPTSLNTTSRQRLKIIQFFVLFCFAQDFILGLQLFLFSLRKQRKNKLPVKERKLLPVTRFSWFTWGATWKSAVSFRSSYVSRSLRIATNRCMFVYALSWILKIRVYGGYFFENMSTSKVEHILKKLEDDGFPGQDGLLLWRGQFIKRSRTFQETIFSSLSTLKDARKNSYSL